MRIGIPEAGNARCVRPLRSVLATAFCAFVSAFLSTQARAVPFQQAACGDSLVSIEVEDFDANISQGGNSWTDILPPPTGYSGTGALEATPNTGTNNNTGFETSSPRLDYSINFVKTGVHYVWIRGLGPTFADDSLHVGLNGVATTASQRISGIGTTLGWTNTNMDSLIATINVATAGVHTLNIWMREDGAIIDKAVLTTNSGYIPSGSGPPASSRGGDPGSCLFEDNFSDGTALDWTVVDNCVKGTSAWSVVSGVFMQTGSCRGFSSEGAAIGTHALSSWILPTDVDIQLRMRSEHPDSDAVTSNDGDSRRFGASGLVFGYQDEDNFYRFEFSGVKGHRKLWRKQGAAGNGVYTELNTSPQSYVQGQWVNVRIVHQAGVILVFIDGQQVMAAADTTFTSGQLGLFCARNASCSFDDIIVFSAPASPMIGLNLTDSVSPAHASSEYFVATGGVLDVSGLTTVATGVGGIEFLVDEGTGSEQSLTDLVAPYTAQFTLPGGDHPVGAYLLDGGGIRLAAAEATTTLPQVGLSGIHLYGIGDSITAGLGDDIVVDDVSIDTRNTAGGYAPILNDHLSTGNTVPVSVLNDGIPGEESWEGALRITPILLRTPEVQAYLAFYGANDSGGALPRPSGLGLNPGDSGYAGSFKDYLQQIVDAVVTPPPAGAGKLIFLAKAPPYLSNSTRNAAVNGYNQVVDELVAQLRIDYPASYLSYVPPDFYSYFTANPTEIGADGIHPVGLGYQSMARLWCEALNGQQAWRCLDDDGDGLVNSVEALLGTNPLLADSDGDGLVDGDGGIVLVELVAGGVDADSDGFADGEQTLGTDPLSTDSDGDLLGDGVEVANGADPLDPNSWPNLADGDLAPLGLPNGVTDAGDLVVCMRIALGLVPATALELAHGDLYPPGNPDGIINIQDLILLQQMP